MKSAGNATTDTGLLSAADCKDQDTEAFRSFKCQLYNTSLSHILEPITPAMKVPKVVRCPDAHFRQVVYGVVPDTMDYLEQALAACILEGCPM